MLAWWRGALAVHLLQEGIPGRAEESYIHHVKSMQDPNATCNKIEGIGRGLCVVAPILNLAAHHNLTYVCNPRDFDTAGHASGNLGFLFGCSSDNNVDGGIKAYADVMSDTRLHRHVANLSNSDVFTRILPVAEKGERHPEWRAQYRFKRVEQGTLYEVETPDCLRICDQPPALRLRDRLVVGT